MEIIKELPQIFEEFAEQKKQSFLKVKELKEKGIPVVGAYCSYFPKEIAIAAGAIPISLCSYENSTVIEAEKILPKGVCPLVKSSYGFAVTDRCPYFYFSDVVIGETTCDGKTKMYELMAEFKNVYVMHLPHTQSPQGYELWEKEIIGLKEYLGEQFQVIITDEEVRKAIILCNQHRRSMKRLCEVMKLDPVPVPGQSLFKMLNGYKFRLDLEDIAEEIDGITEKILSEYSPERMEKRPRLLITGCPIGGDTEKIIYAIENNGGVCVAFENCVGVKMLDMLVDEEDENVYHALSRRYLSMGCAIMTPNHNRIELLGRIIDEFRVDGVVDMVLQGCTSVSMEAVNLQYFIDEEKSIPYLNITTDYSPADIGQLNTRMAAFIEMIKEKKK